jgi:pimeloyl-ACP methyl ester carboxylesterase
VRQSNVPFLAYPSAKQGDPSRRQCLIFFIPGNPGLVAYYVPFLSTLRQLLDEKEARQDCRHAFHIYARNLLGFEDSDHDPAFGTLAADGVRIEPYTLEDQIRCLCEQVHEINASALPPFPADGSAEGRARVFDQVILIGHSVGAYIALEIFNRHHHSAPSSPLSSVKLTAGILLFPTVSHIARSRSGQKLDLLRRTPFLDRTAHHMAKGFADLWPRWLLEAIVRRVLGQPEHAARATISFLTSKDGIWQALHMGKDEMRTISEEKWSEDLWEIQDAQADGETRLAAAKFFFYFAETDHWVADECRDEFIEKRRRHEKGKTKIVIDGDAIPHGFCISESRTVTSTTTEPPS